MKARRKIGDIVEFSDRGGTLVDRISSVYISSKTGVTYWLEQYDGTVSDKEMVRVVEAGPDPGLLHETWPTKYRSGQRIRFKYMDREEEGEIEEVEWRFNKDEKSVCYWLSSCHDVEEKDVICEMGTPSTKSDQPSSGLSSKKPSTDELPANERGPRLVKSTE